MTFHTHFSLFIAVPWPLSRSTQLTKPNDILYCKSANFRENFIFANNVKRHICDAKNSQLEHDLHLSVDSFTKPRTCTLVNFTGETKNVHDCLLFVIFF